jgi:hypothetical protein
MAWKGTEVGAAKDNGIYVRGNETSWSLGCEREKMVGNRTWSLMHCLDTRSELLSLGKTAGLYTFFAP